jgi:hypothetical protein
VGPHLIAGALLLFIGCAWVAIDSAAWYVSQQMYAIYDQQSLFSLVLRYYFAEALAICVLLAGAYLTCRGIRVWEETPDSGSIRHMLGEALSSRRDLRIGVVAGILYAFVYLVVSSVIVFQPGANYEAWRGVTAFSWAAAACCGSVGTVPSLVFYLSPQAHLALQVLPLDALLAVVAPLLVGLNVTIAVHAVRNREVGANVGWMSTLGVLAGLFTGCPTCAGLFLASVFGGLGATTLAVALAPYQMLFVVISIPLLAVSPIVISLCVRRAQRAACPVPQPGA